MKLKQFLSLILIVYAAGTASAEESITAKTTISYNDYIIEIEKSLPELKSNEMNILLAENKVKSAKSGGDISLNAGGNVFSTRQYSGINNKGDVNGYDYSAGLSKTITTTGTTVSGTYNYSKNDYSNFSSISDYTAYEPSVSLKITQPLLYNFFGRVDRFSENNAKMQLEIAKSQLQENNRSVLNAYKKLYFQWIMYNEIVKNLDDAIRNSNTLKEQIKRKVNAGLADNDDYQSSITSVLSYENQRRGYLTSLNNIESQLNIYLKNRAAVPDDNAFSEYFKHAGASGLIEVNFKNTTSAKMMDLTMQNYAYSKGVYENRLLPELNVFAGMTRKDISESPSYNTKDTDYNVGFEFKYSLENNSAESSLKDVEIQIQSLEYEYSAAQNSYRKQLLNYIESSNGITEQLANRKKTLQALESKLVTERKKYSQARLSLSYVINTENSITSERNSIVLLKYQLIGNYLDYMDLIK